MNLGLAAMGITLAIETPIVALAFRRQAARLALACAVTTCATNLFMNFVLVRRFHFGLAFGEGLAFGVEALVYFLVARPHPLRLAVLASLLANLASYFGGIALFRLLLAS